MTTTSAVAAVAMTAALLGGFTACAGDDSDPAKPKSVGSEKSAISGDTGGLKDPTGAVEAMTKVVCKAGPDGAWSATGTLTNEEAEPRKFLVKFAVVKKKTSEVLGSKEATFELAAGESVEVSMKNIHRGKKQGPALVCVPRVVSGT